MSNIQAQFEKKLEVKAFVFVGPAFGPQKFNAANEIYENYIVSGYGGAMSYNINRSWGLGIKYSRSLFHLEFKDDEQHNIDATSTTDAINVSSKEFGLNLRYNLLHRQKFKIYTQGSLLGILQQHEIDPFSFTSDGNQTMEPFVYGAEVSLGLKRNIIKDLGFFFDLAYAYQAYYHGPRFRLGLFLDLINE
jgi:hypothetical protein